jgi:hypothetical protein
MSVPFKGLLRTLALLTLAVAALACVAWLNPNKPGLRAQFYDSADRSGTPTLSRVDDTFNTATLLATFDGNTPETFSAAWSGALLVWRSGSYTFQLVSDDGSWLYIDGTRIIDNGGQHGAQPASTTVTLERGVHAVRLEYTQQGGRMALQWRWTADGGTLVDVPALLLTPRRADFWSFAATVVLRRALVALEWLWLALSVAVCLAWGWQRVARYAPLLRPEGAWPALPLLITGSLLLNAVAVWWGLPGGFWPPDELTPKDVAVALSRHFSHGWFERYPPFHFYVLTAAHAPVAAMEWAGLVHPGSVAGETMRALLGRFVSLAAGAGTLGLLFASSRRLFGARVALLATALFALVAPFVYYAKTANLDVPYLFWFALAFWFLLRVLDRPRLVDVAGYGCAATLSICTKDQAYGLFALPSLLILWRLWREHRARDHSASLVRALFDPRLLAGAAAAVGLFAVCHNLLFNWSGFVAHVAIIMGGASQGYRMFPSTIAGQLALFALTARIVTTALGWPLLVCTLAGALLAWLAPATRRAALIVSLPTVSYYLTFVAIVGYNYDRFLLPAFYLFAMFGGVALDRWLQWSLPRPLRLAGVTVVFAYSLLYAATVDVLMLEDSRYTVEDYFDAHARETDRIGYVFPSLYNPRVDRWPNAEVTSLEQLLWERPRWFVLNVEYGRTEPSDSTLGQVVSGVRSGVIGYRPVFETRTPNPFPWLPLPHRDLTGPRDDGPTEVTSSLRHINPLFVVYERRD